MRTASAGPYLRFLRPVPLVLVVLFTIAVVRAHQYYLVALAAVAYAVILIGLPITSRRSAWAVSWGLFVAILSVGLYLLR